jgi:hypothetical protein
MKIEKIAETLDVTIEQATKIKGIVNGTIDPLTFNSVKKWVDQCYNMPSKLELKLEAINEILEGYGVEYIESIDDTFNDMQGLSYVNLGDTYINTVIYDHSSNVFKYCSYGDIIESEANYI